MSSEVTLIDDIDHKSNVSVGNNNSINISITNEKEELQPPTTEITPVTATAVDSHTELPQIIQTTAVPPPTIISKPNEFNGYIYYKNSRFNLANEIDITTESLDGNYFYAINPQETFRPSKLDMFRNKFESSLNVD